MLAHWLGIIRPINLLLLAAGMYAIDAFLLQPNFSTYGILFTLAEWQFFLLVVSVVLICAGGYILNDIYDQELDKINKPHKVFIGEGKLSAASAYRVYIVGTFIGLGIGVYLSIAVDFWKLVAVYVLAIALLYFYATSFKRMALVGNFIVSLLSALSLIMVLIYEPHLYDLARPGDYYVAGICTRFILSLAVFAFATTMIREIVKDMEDVEGDAAHGASTMPVKWGMGVSRIVTLICIAATIGALVYLLLHVLDKEVAAFVIYTAVMASCLFAVAVWLTFARTKSQLHKISNFMKLIMVIGLLILPIYYLIQF